MGGREGVRRGSGGILPKDPQTARKPQNRNLEDPLSGQLCNENRARNMK
jgi:hypothetical protein